MSRSGGDVDRGDLGGVAGRVAVLGVPDLHAAGPEQVGELGGRVARRVVDRRLAAGDQARSRR